MNFTVSYETLKSFLTTDFSLFEVGVTAVAIVLVFKIGKYLLVKGSALAWKGIVAVVSGFRLSLISGLASMALVGAGISELDAHRTAPRLIIDKAEAPLELYSGPIAPWPSPIIAITVGLGGFIFSCIAYSHSLSKATAITLKSTKGGLMSEQEVCAMYGIDPPLAGKIPAGKSS